ncbi:NUDIX hydrolase [Actomonas aquatica]|uniref:NUDIX hydrolase n=1 Tax=Actomonas aquatica TaxID=2866162 RepID=A0ABZ1CBV1_9BACT|nr:NUDIX hydrolase [Opitutus sp. WL0086]WRQ88792.1 NUDIX hydrolase [Opitutus sp. WL0086]
MAVVGTREHVAALLRAHLVSGAEAGHEAAMVEATLSFVEAEPRCAERSLEVGHLTGSAWIVDRTRRKTLLTHHRKLNMWLQLGGHADGDLDIAAVAMREAEEESGLSELRLVSPTLFDVDRHRIPARKGEPEHWHYDLRFMVEANADEAFVVSDESHDLAWIEIERMAEFNSEESMLRMARKTGRMVNGEW